MSFTLADVRAAAERIAGRVERTPMRKFQTLSVITGAEGWVKFENLQFTACPLYPSPSPRDLGESRMPYSA